MKELSQAIWELRHWIISSLYKNRTEPKERRKSWWSPRWEDVWIFKSQILKKIWVSISQINREDCASKHWIDCNYFLSAHGLIAFQLLKREKKMRVSWARL
jgi:hypothetical protein